MSRVRARQCAGAGGAALLLLTGAGLGGCGDDASPERVSVRVTAPGDQAVVRNHSIEVRGRVRPSGARVAVSGRHAPVTAGEFRATVPLRPGPNLIDVGASAPGARTAWAAVRVTLEVRVRVPDLGGQSRDDAVNRLHALGLRTEVDEDKVLLDPLLPLSLRVCESHPDAGAELRKGSVVRLVVSKRC